MNDKDTGRAFEFGILSMLFFAVIVIIIIGMYSQVNAQPDPTALIDRVTVTFATTANLSPAQVRVTGYTGAHFVTGAGDCSVRGESGTIDGYIVGIEYHSTVFVYAVDSSGSVALCGVRWE